MFVINPCPESLDGLPSIWVIHLEVDVIEPSGLCFMSKRAVSVKGCFWLGRNLVMRTCRRSSNEVMDPVGRDRNQLLAFTSKVMENVLHLAPSVVL